MCENSEMPLNIVALGGDSHAHIHIHIHMSISAKEPQQRSSFCWLGFRISQPADISRYLHFSARHFPDPFSVEQNKKISSLKSPPT